MTDLGVVDPIRVPARLARLGRRTPRLAWVFVGLFLVAAIVRWVLLARSGGQLPRDVQAYLSAIISFDLVILLPAFALMRRPDLPRTAALVHRGLVLIGAAAFLRGPARLLDDLYPTLVGADPLTGAPGFGSFILNAAITLVTALGIVALALGLRATASGDGEPAGRASGASTATAGADLRRLRPVVAGAAASVIVAMVVVESVAQMLTSPPWASSLAGDVATGIGLTTIYLASYLQAIAWAPLAWVLVRGSAARAGRADAAALLFVGATILLLALYAVSVVAPAAIAPVADAFNRLTTAVALAAPSLLVAAVALGLADPAPAPPHPRGLGKGSRGGTAPGRAGSEPERRPTYRRRR